MCVTSFLCYAMLWSVFFYVLGAPNASGIRSMLNLRLLMYMIGTPGIFLIFLLRSLSQVATM
jgi:hypothetical protein